MVIQHNLLAANANRQVGIIQSNLLKSSEKLSSGYKINRAADDAAGLSISEKMRKQIRGLSQATENVQDGISLCKVADGALSEVHDMLQRMNELAVQAANGINSNSDRAAIENEFQQLITEIDRIGNTTKFNEMKIFEGDDGSSIIINSGGGGSLTAPQYEYITYDPADFVSGEEIYDFNGQQGFLSSDFGRYSFGFMDVSNSIKFENAILSLHLPKKADYIMITFRISGEKAYLDMRQTDLDDKPSTLGGLDYLHMSRDNVPPVQLTLASGTCTINDDGSYKLDYGDFGYVVIGHLKGEGLSTAINKNAIVLNLKSKSKPGNVINYDKYNQPVSTNGNGSNGAVPYNDKDLLRGKKWWIQSGAELGEGMFVHTGKLNRRVLNLEGVTISTEENATKAIDYISNANKRISAQRSMIGAEQNRLESAQRIDDNVIENTQYAESKIRDTDIAMEMVKHSNNTILAQAGQSMLAQANQSNASVLSLV